MEYRKIGDNYYIRMDRGDEIISNLLEICEKESIPSAVCFSDHARYIRVTPKLSNTHTETQPKLSGSYIGATYYL